MLKITATNYDELVARADKPVLLDFWAEWCGPCRMVSPVVEEIAASHPEIAVGKVNVDEEPALAQAFRVQSIPMLVLLRDNAVVAAAVGAQSKEQLEQKLGL
ncbi:thioredoxin [Faecousia sp.]|uniref:thioredoxin n=1 Tax=Faecousia sp. TaxID=2952921 RepID=UPI002422678C|nr:thioredoxin [Bacillota bacterium]MDY5341950.1 thioredoxin [Candidatus Faecousia sp.]